MEIKEDLSFLKQSFFNKTFKEYRYDGINGPVIGIHGVLAGWPVNGARQFMVSNKIKGVLMYLGPFLNNIDSYLPKIVSEIKNYPNPTLVGFSNGGFLAIRYAQKFGWNKIKNIITVATPFNGNSKKYQFIGDSIRETLEGSTFINKIRLFNSPENKIVSIFAKEDKHTSHPELLKLNWPVIITNAQSHGEIQNHQEYFAQIILNELKK